MGHSLWVLLTLAMLACNANAGGLGGDDQKDGGVLFNGDAETRFDSGDESKDTGSVDPVIPFSEAIPCHPQFVSELAIAPDFGTMQLFPDAAFDGKSIFVAFNYVPTEPRSIEVGMTRLSCDGTLTSEIQVNQNTDYKELQPSVATRRDNVFVTWQTDEDTGKVKTDYRVFSERGEALTDAERLLTWRAGAPLDEETMTWKPHAYAYDGDDGADFGVVGIREAVNKGLVSYIQPLDSTGHVSENATDLGDGQVAWHDRNSVYTNGNVLQIAAVVDQGEPDTARKRVLIRSGEAEVLFGIAGSLSAADVASVPAQLGKTLAIYGESIGDGQTVLQLVVVEEIGGKLIEQKRLVTQPRVGAYRSARAVFDKEGNGLLVWMQQLGGTKHALFYQTIDWRGEDLILAEPKHIETSSPISTVTRPIALPEGYFALVWQEGRNPDFRLKASIFKP